MYVFFKFSILLLRSFNNSLFDLEQSFRDFFGNIFSRQVSRGTKCLCQNLSFSFADHSDVCMCRIFVFMVLKLSILVASLFLLFLTWLPIHRFLWKSHKANNMPPNSVVGFTTGSHYCWWWIENQVSCYSLSTQKALQFWLLLLELHWLTLVPASPAAVRHRGTVAALQRPPSSSPWRP